MRIPSILRLVVVVLLHPRVILGGETPFQSMRLRAQELSQQPFDPNHGAAPTNVLDLTYVAHGAIQFRHDYALWRGSASRYQVEFFHPGYIHKRMIDLSEDGGSGRKKVPFRPEAFTYGTNVAFLSTNGGYAGFKITHPSDHFGEVATFLGASYFRLIGKNESYGTSCRGLAVNTTAKEEFPYFREFWFRKPDRDSKTMDFCALLDGESVTGAFEFEVESGLETVVKVRAAFFPRKEIHELGIAPLTSMFLHDQNGRPVYEDFRPEVHDSDGLLLQTGEGRWIWRPLDKGKMLRVNAYGDNNPKGFGLMQRDRNFEHYQDLVARFERRPNIWIKPTSAWGSGAVTLVQIPSNIEFSDNIVVYWVPKEPARPGKSLEFSYEIHAGMDEPEPANLAQAQSTGIGVVVEEPARVPPNLRFVVDFKNTGQGVLADDGLLKACVHCGDGATITNYALIKNAVNNTWRLAVETTQPTKAVDLTANLLRKNHPVSETWNFTWQP